MIISNLKPLQYVGACLHLELLSKLYPVHLFIAKFHFEKGKNLCLVSQLPNSTLHHNSENYSALQGKGKKYLYTDPKYIQHIWTVKKS